MNASPGAVADIIVLHGARTSLVLECVAGGAPLWRYWGPALHADGAPWPPLASQRPTPSSSPDTDQPFSLFPTFGGGWFNQSALLAHRDGRDFHQAFQRCEIDWREPGRAAVVRLFDDVAALTIEVSLAMSAEDDTLTISTVLTNTGDGVLEVQWLAAGVLPLPERSATVRSFVGRHMDEFRPVEDALSRSGWRRENRRGLTSHGCFPGAVVTTPGTTHDTGLTYGVHLAWSGNHAQLIDSFDDGRFQWQMGEWLAPGEVRLGPGERLASPEMIAVCSAGGLNGVAQGFHVAARRRIAWPGGTMRPRPASLNTWEGFYFRHDQAELRQLASLAAGIGMERFVLDDGWFRGRNNDTTSLGDWTPDPAKYPEGLGDLIDYVTGLGLEFGLWVEPEMVNPDSDLLRAHPDWALELAGRPRLTARNQLVLDLTRPEVVDYLFGAIDTLLRGHPIGYLKWDHNRDLATAGGADGRAAYHNQILAAYGLMARLRAAHPEVEIEACAGGGGRIDMGVLRHTHRFWTSDNIDAVSRLGIQRGFLQFFPPEIMGAHVGADPAHTTGRGQSMAFRAAVALPGHFGVELDLRKLDTADLARLADKVRLYKDLRGILHGGRVWLGDGEDGMVWQAHADAAETELVVLAYRADPASFGHAAPLRLPMLAAEARYRVRRVDRDADAEGQIASGARLGAIGWPMPPLRAERAVILRLTRLDGPT